MTLSPRNDYLWLGVILVLAATLRIVGLNAPLWYDEILTIETHLRMNWGEMLQSYSMNHHYLHDLFAKASMQVFGEDPWAIRLPAMILGLGAIAALWWLARDLAGPVVAHVTALLLALSYHQIWFAQNARGYTGLALFCTLGLILFLRGLAQPRRATWLGFAASLAVATFTHLTGAFFFLALGLVWLALILAQAARGGVDRALVRLPILGFVAGGVLSTLLYLPILPGVLETVSAVSQTSAVDVMKEYQNPLWTVYEAVRTGIGTAGPLVTLVALAVLGLSVLGAVAMPRRGAIFAPVVLVHILLTTAILLALGMRIWPRFFFADIGFLLLLIVLGVRFCCDLGARLAGGRGARPFFAAAVLAMVALSALLALRNYSSPKQDLAGAYAWVEATRRPGEPVIAIGYAGNAFRDHFHADWQTVFTDEDYRAAMAVPGPVIVVVAFPGRSFRSLPALAADRDTVLAEARYFPGTLGDGAVYVLTRN